jgi:hypothetical protein
MLNRNFDSKVKKDFMIKLSQSSQKYGAPVCQVLVGDADYKDVWSSNERYFQVEYKFEFPVSGFGRSKAVKKAIRTLREFHGIDEAIFIDEENGDVELIES